MLPQSFLHPSCSACRTCPVPWKWTVSTQSCTYLVFSCLICLRMNASSVKFLCQDLCGFWCLTLLQYRRWIYKKCVFSLCECFGLGVYAYRWWIRKKCLLRFVWMLWIDSVFVRTMDLWNKCARIFANSLTWLLVCTDDGSVKAYKVGIWCG